MGWNGDISDTTPNISQFSKAQHLNFAERDFIVLSVSVGDSCDSRLDLDHKHRSGSMVRRISPPRAHQVESGGGGVSSASEMGLLTLGALTLGLQRVR